eukprot:779874-Pelagomonas_calceolata.AAC.6
METWKNSEDTLGSPPSWSQLVHCSMRACAEAQPSPLAQRQGKSRTCEASATYKPTMLLLLVSRNGRVMTCSDDVQGNAGCHI